MQKTKTNLCASRWCRVEVSYSFTDFNWEEAGMDKENCKVSWQCTFSLWRNCRPFLSRGGCTWEHSLYWTEARHFSFQSWPLFGITGDILAFCFLIPPARFWKHLSLDPLALCLGTTRQPSVFLKGLALSCQQEAGTRTTRRTKVAIWRKRFI